MPATFGNWEAKVSIVELASNITSVLKILLRQPLLPREGLNPLLPQRGPI